LLVGPRSHAIIMKAGRRLYYEAIEEYVRRHRVKPGITGWAQVKGFRDEVDTLDKVGARVEQDLYYIGPLVPLGRSEDAGRDPAHLIVAPERELRVYRSTNHSARGLGVQRRATVAFGEV